LQRRAIAGTSTKRASSKGLKFEEGVQYPGQTTIQWFTQFWYVPKIQIQIEIQFEIGVEIEI
jgi:hypothetical protein